MHRKGHIGFGLLLSTPFIYYSVAVTGNFMLGVITILLVSSLSPLPDIDFRLPLVTHRGITHTVWYLLGVSLLLAVGSFFTIPHFVSEPVETMAFFAGVGAVSIGSHIIADWITPMGVQPLFPIHSTQKSANLVRSDNQAVNTTLFVLGIGTVLGIGYSTVFGLGVFAGFL